MTSTIPAVAFHVEVSMTIRQEYYGSETGRIRWVENEGRQNFERVVAIYWCCVCMYIHTFQLNKFKIKTSTGLKTAHASIQMGMILRVGVVLSQIYLYVDFFSLSIQFGC